MTDPKSPSRWHSLPSALALGALIGALLSLFRAGSILVMERGMRLEAESELVQWQVFGQFQVELPGHLLLGALAGFWIWLWAGRFRGSLVIAALGAATLMGYLMAGDVLGPDTRAMRTLVDESDAGPGLYGLVCMPILAALLATAFVAIETTRTPRIRFGRLIGVGLIVFFLGVLPSSIDAVMTGERPVMNTTEVARELILEEKSWNIRFHHPDGKPHAGIITPTPDHRADGGELPAIIMAPPCELQYVVTEEDGPVRLNIVAGVDFSVDDELTRTKRQAVGKSKGFRFIFEVKRNEERVFDASSPDYMKFQKGDYKNHRNWMRPGEDVDLTFDPGDVITLRVGARGIDNRKLIKLAPYQVGFGAVTLEKAVVRERQLSDERTPSIVLIVQDTMRADRSSTYGYGKDTTPALSALAARGINYTNAHSASSWTWPSTASILTGLLPDAHGVTDDSSCYLVGRNETLAEALQARGYTTGAFTCNPLVSVEKNFNQGFENYSATARKFIKTDTVMADMKSWMRTQRGSRFFLYLHLVDPHLPYAPREEDVQAFASGQPSDFPDIQEIHHEYKGVALKGGGVDEHGHPKFATFPDGHIEYLSSMYDACIATGDFYVAELVDYLYELGLTDDTIVAFTSDHGEAWMEHGGLTHGQSLHQELVRIPLVIAGPGIPEGVVCDTPVSNRHLAATLAGVGGAEMRAIPDPIDLARPEHIDARPVYFATTHGTWNNRHGRQPLYGVRDGQWVLHYAPLGSDYGVKLKDAPVGGQYRLYNVHEDPLETKDVSKQHPKVAERLKTMVLDNIAEQLGQHGDRINIGAGAATVDLLDGIGYNVGKIMPGEEEE